MSIRNYPSSLVWAFFKRHFLDDSQFGTMYKTTKSSQSYIEFIELKNEIIFHDFDKFFCYSWLQHRYLSKRESRRSKIWDILESTKTIICCRWERYFTMVIVDSLLRQFLLVTGQNKQSFESNDWSQTLTQVERSYMENKAVEKCWNWRSETLQAKTIVHPP